MKFTLVFSFLFILSISSVTVAQKPGTINYEGILKDSNGVPLNGTYDLVFTFYDDSIDGNILWRESYCDSLASAIIIDSGLFSVLLGSQNKISEKLLKERGRWLGIKVGTEPEISPRIKLNPGVYSYQIQAFDHKRTDKQRKKCSWSDRFSADCRSFTLIEWGLKTQVSESVTPNAFDESESATIEVGGIRSLSKNSALGATVYLATGDDWRVGPRLRYRRWLNDELALDFSSGVTWNILRRDVQDEVEGKMGSSWYVGLNYKDKAIFCLEYDVFPKWSWAGGEWLGSKKTQRALYMGVTAGSNYGASMVIVTVVAVIYAVTIFVSQLKKT